MKNAILILATTICCAVSAAQAGDFAQPSILNGLQLAQSTYSASASGGEILAQSYGPVQAQESLWSIARQFRSDRVTMSQLMMAIYRHNPEAFHKENINRLKVGAMLKIPGVTAIREIGSKQAYRQASSQIEAYEIEARQAKVARGELAPLSQVPRDPELEPLVSAVDLAQIEIIKDELKKEEQQLAAPAPPAKPVIRKEKPKPPLFRYSYEVAVLNDDNVRLAQNDLDIRDDLIVSGTLKARGGKSLDSFSIWNYGGSITYNAFDTFDGLNNVDFELNTSYRFALSSGFTAPIYALGIKLGGVDYDTEMRDATKIALSADLNKWVTNTINMTAGLGYNWQESKSETYDTTQTRLFINFDTNFSKTALVYTTLTYVTGDVVSSASPTLDIINAADAIEPDDAFGGVVTNQFAYRLDAETLLITLGFNKIMTPDLSLDFSARFVDTEAKADTAIGYDRTILRASLLGRF